MRTLSLIILLLVLILIAGAILSFPVYKFLHLFSDISFHKLIPHVTSMTAVILLVGYLRYRRCLDAATLGYAPVNDLVLLHLATGFTGGIMIMLILAVILLLLGIQQFDSDLTFNIVTGGRILAGALVTGMIVGLFEETLYRGALLGLLAPVMRPVAAVTLSSSIYSAVHFLKFSEVLAGAGITWDTGLSLLAGAFHRFSEPATLDAFLSLFAFGALLALLRIKNGTIYQCVGLHAGAVTAIRIINKTMDYVPGTSLPFLVNRYDHLLGNLATVWLTVCILAYYRLAWHESGKKSLPR